MIVRRAGLLEGARAATGVAVARLVDREVDVGVHAVGLEEALLGAEEPEVATGSSPAPSGQLGLAESDDVLGEREARDDGAIARDGLKRCAPKSSDRSASLT